MPIFTKNGKSVFFSHIPKTAGTSIERFFQQNEYVKTFYSVHRKPCSFQHRQKDDVELIEKLKSTQPILTFTVIREPLERILSQFGMFHRNNSFTEHHFHEYVLKVFELYRQNPFVDDNHIRPQSHFIHKNMKVYKFGEWDDMISDLSNYCDFKNKVLPHTQKSQKWEWTPLPETEEIVRDFYREDYKIWRRINKMKDKTYLSM